MMEFESRVGEDLAIYHAGMMSRFWKSLLLLSKKLGYIGKSASIRYSDFERLKVNA